MSALTKQKGTKYREPCFMNNFAFEDEARA